MKITIKPVLAAVAVATASASATPAAPAWGAEIVLASADHEGFPAENLRFDGKQLVDVAEPIGAASVSLFARGNKRHTISFRTTRTYESPIEAQTAYVVDSIALPATGLLTLYLETAGFPGEQEVYALAGVTGFPGVTNGSALIRDYQLVTGAFSTTTPTAPTT